MILLAVFTGLAKAFANYIAKESGESFYIRRIYDFFPAALLALTAFFFPHYFGKWVNALFYYFASLVLFSGILKMFDFEHAVIIMAATTFFFLSGFTMFALLTTGTVTNIKIMQTGRSPEYTFRKVLHEAITATRLTAAARKTRADSIISWFGNPTVRVETGLNRMYYDVRTQTIHAGIDRPYQTLLHEYGHFVLTKSTREVLRQKMRDMRKHPLRIFDLIFFGGGRAPGVYDDSCSSEGYAERAGIAFEKYIYPPAGRLKFSRKEKALLIQSIDVYRKEVNELP